MPVRAPVPRTERSAWPAQILKDRFKWYDNSEAVSAAVLEEEEDDDEGVPDEGEVARLLLEGVRKGMP